MRSARIKTCRAVVTDPGLSLIRNSLNSPVADELDWATLRIWRPIDSAIRFRNRSISSFAPRPLTAPGRHPSSAHTRSLRTAAPKARFVPKPDALHTPGIINRATLQVVAFSQAFHPRGVRLGFPPWQSRSSNSDRVYDQYRLKTADGSRGPIGTLSVRFALGDTHGFRDLIRG